MVRRSEERLPARSVKVWEDGQIELGISISGSDRSIFLNNLRTLECWFVNEQELASIERLITAVREDGELK